MNVHAGYLEDVKAIFGFHVWPASPAGQVLTKAGTALSPAGHIYVLTKLWKCHLSDAPEHNVQNQPGAKHIIVIIPNVTQYIIVEIRQLEGEWGEAYHMPWAEFLCPPPSPLKPNRALLWSCMQRV